VKIRAVGVLKKILGWVGIASDKVYQEARDIQEA
jgi:hypothetical protein